MGHPGADPLPATPRGGSPGRGRKVAENSVLSSSQDQYIKFRALIIEDFGPQEWEKASKKRRIKIVRKTMELFRASPWWTRLMTECPPDADGYWRPRLKDDEEDKLTAELEVLVAKMRIARDKGTPEEKLELLEALYRLMRRMNGKSAYGDD